MTVTFCGHSEIYYSEDIEQKLFDIVEKLIRDGANEFLLGGYGNFDNLAAKTLKKFKKKYPQINSILVIPYLDRKYDLELYDNSVYPPLEGVPLRFAISKRNEWMIQNSEIVVAYVKYSWGGAAKTLSYAEQKKKHIIKISDLLKPNIL